jgi:hypothetical protein
MDPFLWNLWYRDKVVKLLSIEMIESVTKTLVFWLFKNTKTLRTLERTMKI